MPLRLVSLLQSWTAGFENIASVGCALLNQWSRVRLQYHPMKSDLASHSLGQDPHVRIRTFH